MKKVFSFILILVLIFSAFPIHAADKTVPSTIRNGIYWVTLSDVVAYKKNKTFMVEEHYDGEDGIAKQTEDVYYVAPNSKIIYSHMVDHTTVSHGQTRFSATYGVNKYSFADSLPSSLIENTASERPSGFMFYRFLEPTGDESKRVSVFYIVTATYDELQALIREAEKKTEAESEYSAVTWKPYENTLKACGTVKESDSVIKITDAYTALYGTRDALRYDDGHNYTQKELKALVRTANTKKKADYTSESWEVFITALQNAGAMSYMEPSEHNQANYNHYYIKLKKAMDALEPAE